MEESILDKNITKQITLRLLLSKLITLLGIMIAVGVGSAIFGANNSLIWVSIVVAFMMFQKMNIGIHKKEAPFVIIGIFLWIGISNRLAMINPFLGFIINLISIFIVMYVPTIKVNQKAYLPFILCYIFGQSTQAVGADFVTRMLSLFVGGMIVAILYYICHRKSVEKHVSLFDMVHQIDIMSDRFILALRMCIGLSIAMFAGHLIGLQKTMWISCSVMSLTQIDFAQTKQRFKYRLLFTPLGVALFVVIFELLVPSEYSLVATFVLSYIYSFITTYKIQIIFVTINALSSSLILFDPSTAIEMRLLLVVCGSILGYVMNRIDFRAIFEKLRTKKEPEALIEGQSSSS